MDEISVLEQLEKRIEWLDNERRNDKNNFSSLQNRLTVFRKVKILPCVKQLPKRWRRNRQAYLTNCQL